MQAPAILSEYQGYNVSCSGGTNGTIEISVSGGDGNYTFSWSNSATTDSIYGLAAGTYTVTIFDGRGCRKDTSITLTAPSPIGVTLLADTFSGGMNVSCYGYADAQVFSNVTGGIAPYQYSWSNGDVTDSAVGLTPGTYTLTVIDSNGCVSVDSVTITQPAPVTLAAVIPNFNGYNLPCSGDSSACIQITMTGGNAPFTFIWDGSDTITSLTRCGLPADTFSVTIMDANACSIDTSFILTAPQPISIVDSLSSFSGFAINCNGQTNGSIDLTLTGGVGPFAYLWTTSDTTEDISGLGAGTYQVNVTDLNGCLDSAAFTLNEPPLFTGSVSSVDPTCGQSNGSATITVSGGVPQYTYSWTGATTQTTATATGLTGGTYYITATDSVGCNVIDSVTINPVPGVTASVSTIINSTCFGGSDGSAGLTINGGISPFIVNWSNGDSGNSSDSLTAGSYYVIVVDSNSCRDSVAFTVGEPNQFGFTYSVTNPYCNGVNNGSAQVTVTGGTSPYTINWSNGDSGTNADSLGGGYTVISIVDNVGCTMMDSVNIIQGNPISTALASSVDVLCYGDSTGSATVLAATGGIGPLTYSWSNGDLGFTADSLWAGSWAVTVSDSVNCSTVVNVTINSPNQLTVSATPTDVSCNGANDGSASTSVNGGTGNYSYLWFPGGSTSATVTNLLPVTYSVTVTDQNNCTAITTAIITEPVAVTTDAGLNQADCSSEFVLDAGITSGYSGTWSVVTGTATFAFPNSPTTSVSGLASGDNVLLWTISNGTCSASDTVRIRRKIQAECELELPSGFSPNDDGFNDGYDIHGIDLYPDNIVTVFNRWGNEVYRKENYVNKEWIGQNNSGEPLPDGTYFLLLQIKGADIKMSTYVDLRR
ncbi:MAG: gliding motility-associated C-terminal domain-containing protein [Bacteroidetes bacterium]|nr:gliding motility-associated C-terminal domain-containing protein [Bacteroidota bacterium]